MFCLVQMKICTILGNVSTLGSPSLGISLKLFSCFFFFCWDFCGGFNLLLYTACISSAMPQFKLLKSGKIEKNETAGRSLCETTLLDIFSQMTQTQAYYVAFKCRFIKWLIQTTISTNIFNHKSQYSFQNDIYFVAVLGIILGQFSAQHLQMG